MQPCVRGELSIHACTCRYHSRNVYHSSSYFDYVLPVRVGEGDVKRMLLLIKADDDRERWLGRLSQITIARDDSALKPPSPGYNIMFVCSVQGR